MTCRRHLDLCVSGLLAVVCGLLVANIYVGIKLTILPLYQPPIVAMRVDTSLRASATSLQKHAAPNGEAFAASGGHIASNGSKTTTGLVDRRTRRDLAAKRVSATDTAQPLAVAANQQNPPADVQKSPLSLSKAKLMTLTTSGQRTASCPRQGAEKPAPPGPAQGDSALPLVTSVQPIGYVVDGEGRQKAIVPFGDGVKVVHVGDDYGDHARVVKITPSAVEIVDLSPQLPVAPAASIAAASVAKVVDTPTDATQAKQTAAVSATTLSPVPSQPVTKSACCLSPLVAYPEHAVTSSSGTETAAARNPAGAGIGEANGIARMAAMRKPTATSAEIRPQPQQPPTQQVVAQSKVDHLGYVRRNNGEVEEIIALDGVLKLVPPPAMLANRYPNLLQGFPIAKSHVASESESPAEKTALNPAEAEVVTTLPTLGYAESMDGQVVSILSDGDGVRLVHKGDVLPEGGRIAMVYQTSVDVAHPPGVQASSFITRDLNSKAEMVEVHDAASNGFRESPVAAGVTVAETGRPVATISAAAKTSVLPSSEAVSSGDGCSDNPPPSAVSEAALESPEDSATSADGSNTIVLAEANQPEDIAQDVEPRQLKTSQADLLPSPVGFFKEIHQRPPPGILPFEDFEASPDQLAPADGVVLRPDTVIHPEGDSRAPRATPCPPRK